MNNKKIINTFSRDNNAGLSGNIPVITRYLLVATNEIYFDA